MSNSLMTVPFTVGHQGVRRRDPLTPGTMVGQERELFFRYYQEFCCTISCPEISQVPSTFTSSNV